MIMPLLSFDSLGNCQTETFAPQAVKGDLISVTKNTLTMEELLAQLTKKSRLECEETHRQLIAAKNALAGLAIIQVYSVIL